MDVLIALCDRSGKVVSADELLALCWGGAPSGDNPLHKMITQLRRALGDSSKQPIYIETIRKRGYRLVAKVVYPHIAHLAGAGGWGERSPFRGLEAFDERHRAVFFGRNQAIMQCCAAVSVGVRVGYALTLVLGPSGSGKTSLVRAGVLPWLANDSVGRATPLLASETSFDFGETRSAGLMTMLASALLDWQVDHQAVFAGTSSAAVGERLQHHLPAVIAEIEALMELRNGSDARLALFIDRFELFFADPSVGAAERQAFLAVLDGLARSKCVLLIVACRNDFYPQLASIPELMQVKAHQGHFDLRPPSKMEVGQMIRGPALAAGLTFGLDPLTGASLDEVLADSAGANPDFLPLLQYTLQELYRLRSSSGELSFAALHQLGGVEGAIGLRAEQVFGALGEPQRAALPRLLSLVVQLSDSGDAVLSAKARWSQLRTDAERELVRALVESRLFVAELIGDQAGFGVAHEALLRRWPRVLDWTTAHRDALEARKRLSQLTARWTAAGRSVDLLLPRGRQLDEAQALAHANTFDLAAEELALISKSARSANRGKRLRTAAVALICVLAGVATATGFSATRAKQSAQERRAEAEGLMEFMLGEFSTQLRPLARLDLLDSVSSKAMAYLSASRSDDMTAASLLHRANALAIIGEVRFARGQAALALDAFMEARNILAMQIAAQPDQLKTLMAAGANAFWIGQIHLAQSDWPKAEQSFNSYQAFSDRMRQIAPQNLDAWVEQSYAHSALGALASKRGDTQTAVREFRASIELKTQALARKPGDATLAADLANSLSWSASVYESLGQFGQAAALYHRERSVLEQLHGSKPREALWTTRLANAVQHQAGLMLIQGDDAAALDGYRQASTLYRSILAEQPDNHEWQGNLIATDLEQIRIRLQHGEAAALSAEIAEINARVVSLRDPGNGDWRKLAALTNQTCAMAKLSLGELPQARQCLVLAQRDIQELQMHNPANLDTRKASAQTWLVRAEFERQSGQPDAARVACEQARELLAKIASGSVDYRILDPWIKAHYCLGQANAVIKEQSQLAAMGYKQASYLHYLSKH